MSERDLCQAVPWLGPPRPRGERTHTDPHLAEAPRDDEARSAWEAVRAQQLAIAEAFVLLNESEADRRRLTSQVADLQAKLAQAEASPELDDLHNSLLSRRAELPHVEFTTEELRTILRGDE